MRCLLICVGMLGICAGAAAQDRGAPTLPDQFEIGRHTFIDVGPPNDFYELILVRPSQNRTSVERITLTPPGDACLQPPTVEVATGSLEDSIPALLKETNPCTIPEKELRREIKRCKKCLAFSGANVAMRVGCGTSDRIIRANILDKDMFDPASNTPQHTSWTMELLSRLDEAVGPGVMDRPMFPLANQEKRADQVEDAVSLREIGAGKYDELFKGAPDRPSDLYRAAQIAPPVPIVKLLSSTPLRPEVYVQPGYPPLARLARIEGTVNVTFDIDSQGTATNLTVDSGHPLLRAATLEAVARWKFQKEAAGERIHAAVEFATNCPAMQK